MKKDVHFLSITNDFWNDSLRWLYKLFTHYAKNRISAEMILNRAKTSHQFSKSKNLQRARKEETRQRPQSLCLKFSIQKHNWYYFISSKIHLNHLHACYFSAAELQILLSSTTKCFLQFWKQINYFQISIPI